MSELHGKPDDADIGRILLDSAKHDGPSRSAVRRARTAVLFAAATGATSTTVAAGTATWAALFKWLGIGVVVGVSAVGADQVLLRTSHDEPAPVSTSVNAPAMSGSEARGGEAATPASETPVSAVASSPQDRGPVARATTLAMASARASAPADAGAKADSAAPPAASSTLAQEVAALDDARRALTAGRATEALGAVDRYERDFPRGHMGQEVAFLRMQALMQSGDREGARRLAEHFLQAHPASPLAPRVRALLGSSDPTE
jgi:hypothetical protein